MCCTSLPALPGPASTSTGSSIAPWSPCCPPKTDSGYLLDAAVGYGYRPWQAGLWLIALTLLGTAAFHTAQPKPVKPGEGAPFSPLVYSLDLLIPIGGLGQRNAWYWEPTALQWTAYAMIAAGWLLTTAVIAGVPRVLNRT